MDYTAIATEIAKPAYAGMTNEEIAAALNLLTATGPSVDVTPAEVSGYLLLSGAFFTVKAFAAGAPTGDATHDAALGAAAALVAILGLPQPPVFRMSNPATAATVKAMVDALLAEEAASAKSTGVTQAVHDGLLALSTPTIPWWQSIGADNPLDHGDIIVAKGERWEDHSIPNYRIQSAIWDAGVVTAKTVSPHPLAIGKDVDLVWSAFVPGAYDGTRTTHVVDDHTLTYAMPIAPDDIGAVSGKEALASPAGAPVGNVTVAR